MPAQSWELILSLPFRWQKPTYININNCLPEHTSAGNQAEPCFNPKEAAMGCTPFRDKITTAKNTLLHQPGFLAGGSNNCPRNIFEMATTVQVIEPKESEFLSPLKARPYTHNFPSHTANSRAALVCSEPRLSTLLLIQVFASYTPLKYTVKISYSLGKLSLAQLYHSFTKLKNTREVSLPFFFSNRNFQDYQEKSIWTSGIWWRYTFWS